MIYLDKIYGTIEITDPVILELLDCPSLVRLKGVDQAGYFEPYFPGTKRSRFEHSVGVYILLKKFGANIEEQISGLIHDVSHSVFSHVADYINENRSSKKQNHQDSIFEEFVKNSEIAEIIKKHNFNLSFILNDKNFLLKENQLPDLCADRIDYLLRDSFCVGKLKNVNYFIDNLMIKNKQWVFKNFESAEKFAELFLRMNNENYAGLTSALMFQTVGDYLKYSLSKKYINNQDLYTTDSIVLSKIAVHLENDEQLKLLFKRMNHQIACKNDPDDYKISIFCKSRMVDPLCEINSKIKRISEIKPVWLKIIREELKPKEFFLKFSQ